MPPEGFTDPITSDETEFHLNTSISELIERITRAVKANDIDSTPPVVETMNGATVMKNEPTLDQIPTTRWGSRKVGLTKRHNARSQNDS